MDDTGGASFRQIETATEAVEVGMQAMESGIGLPDGVTASDMAETLRDTESGTEPDGTPYAEWSPEAKRAAEVAGIPSSARLLGESGDVFLFTTNSVSTRNPNDSGDRFGEWLYDTRDLSVIVSDGTDLTPTIHVARNLSESMRQSAERFEAECMAEARRLAREPIMTCRTEEISKARDEARRRYESEVIAPWESGYDAWRKENDGMALAIAESMRRNRPEWRHRYIPGDVEGRMRRQYERSHPKPEAWNSSMTEYQDAMTRGEARAEARIREEGYDEEAEMRRHLAEVKARRDPEGRHGASEAMLANYDDAMERLSHYPGAAGIAESNLPMTWGNTLGMPVAIPQPWRRRLDDGEIARGFDRDSSLLDASVAELRRANGHTAAILDEVSSHMKGLSEQLRGSGDVDREHSMRMLRLDVARLEQDVDYMRQFVDEDGHTADLAADVARRLRESIRRLK